MGIPALRVHQCPLGYEVHHRGEAAERNTNNSASQHSGLALIYGHFYETPKTRQKARLDLPLAISIFSSLVDSVAIPKLSHVNGGLRQGCSQTRIFV
jgi:hypothetical protein